MTQQKMPPMNVTPMRGNLEAQDRANYHQPSTLPLQEPSVAHVHGAKCLSEGQITEDTRVQSSVSSASGSSAYSYQKRHTASPGSQWPSPNHERTLVESEREHVRQSAQWQSAGSMGAGHAHKKSEMTEINSHTLAYVRRQQHVEFQHYDDEGNDHALWVLFWLSALDPVHSLASSLFAFMVTFGLTLATPIRLFRKQSSFGDQTIRTLAPLFKNHLELMYASSADYAFEWEFRPGMLIGINLISPLFSIGVAVAAWITAAFWIFTSIMGNPDGTERRDDGADAVLAVRNWWERCLLTATHPRVRLSMRSVV